MALMQLKKHCNRVLEQLLFTVFKYLRIFRLFKILSDMLKLFKMNDINYSLKKRSITLNQNGIRQ